MPTADEHERALRGASLRVTRSRLAVLDAVHERPHADTSTLIGLVRGRLGDVSHQAVYDGLRDLAAAGLVRRLQPPGSVARYEARVGDDHHHLVCRDCGAIADVDPGAGRTPRLAAGDAHGYAVDATEVIFWGVCPECSTTPATA